jgi:hypothetical protein
MKFFTQARLEKVKSDGEFVAGIVALVAVLYGFSWLADNTFAHAHLQVDRQWWAYRVWHAWWWVIVSGCMVAIGWRYCERTLGGSLWALGTICLIFLGCAACLVFPFDLIDHAFHRVGFFWVVVLTCVCVFLLALGSVVVGHLVHRMRNRLGG